MNIRELLNQATKKLKQSTSPGLDAEVLLSHVLDKPKEYLLTNPNKNLTPKQEKQYKILVSRRQIGWPVAYITKQKEFLGRKFQVDKNVLIPRPETEGLVELVLSHVSSPARHASQLAGVAGRLSPHPSILDIGTGSGAIIVSLAKSLPRAASRGKLFASDVSSAALKVAQKNAKLHGAKITFKQGSLLQPWKNGHFDVIVANLPYLAKETDASTKFEPKLALVAKKQGLALFEELFKQVSSPARHASQPAGVAGRLSPRPSSLFLEIGHDQGPAIKKLARKYLPAFQTKISKDLSGRERYAILSQISS